MNKIVARCLLIVSIGCVICLSFSAPWVLNDKNLFLKNFVNHEFLNLLGVVLAITIASAANIHFEFNKIEDILGTEFLSKTRDSLKSSIYLLIISFGIGTVLSVTKPLIGEEPISISLINGTALLLVLINILVLVDITALVFKIKPTSKVKKLIEGDGVDETTKCER